nr:hypothetical protein [Neorhizobium tomejilense]
MDLLETLDAKLIELVDRIARSARRALRLSYPVSMAIAASALIVSIALSVFLPNSNLLTTKLPLLFLCAVLAATGIRQLHDHYEWMQAGWTPEFEAMARRSAFRLRRKMFAVRLVVGLMALIQVTISGAFAGGALSSGAGYLEVFSTVILPALLGLPAVFIYYYLVCSDPSP